MSRKPHGHLFAALATSRTKHTFTSCLCTHITQVYAVENGVCLQDPSSLLSFISEPMILSPKIDEVLTKEDDSHLFSAISAIRSSVHLVALITGLGGILHGFQSPLATLEIKAAHGQHCHQQQKNETQPGHNGKMRTNGVDKLSYWE